MSTSLPERVIYLGFTAIGLAIFGFTRGLKTKYRETVILFGICLVLMLWVSGPAFITFRGLKIPFPSYFLYRLFPMFRSYVRLGILVLLCTCVLSAFGVKFLFEKVKNKKRFAIYGLLFTTFVLFESLNFPPFHNTDFSPTPQVYQWLRSQPGDFVIAEYPRDNQFFAHWQGSSESIIRDYNYGKFFQRVHNKKLFQSQYLNAETRKKLADLANSETPKILSSYGVKYVVAHTREIFEGENPLDTSHGAGVMRHLEPEYKGLKRVAKFPGAVVYQVL